MEVRQKKVREVGGGERGNVPTEAGRRGAGGSPDSFAGINYVGPAFHDDGDRWPPAMRVGKRCARAENDDLGGFRRRILLRTNGRSDRDSDRSDRSH